jgi:hypothetical protein
VQSGCTIIHCVHPLCWYDLAFPGRSWILESIAIAVHQLLVKRGNVSCVLGDVTTFRAVFVQLAVVGRLVCRRF